MGWLLLFDAIWRLYDMTGFSRTQMSRLQIFRSFLLVVTTCVIAPANSQFHVVAKRKLFVDRTLLIERVFTRINASAPFTWHPKVLIGPSKSGKTINLSMIKQFFELRVDKNGRVQAPNATEHYALFKCLKIGQRPYFEKHFSSSPVIHLDLADFVVNAFEVDFKTSFCRVARKLIEAHLHLWRGLDDRGFSKEEMKTYLDPETCGKKHQSNFECFGNNLAMRMTTCFNAHVLLLIDNIDAPALSIVKSSSSMTNVESIKCLFSFVRQMIEGSNFVWGTFMTGGSLQGVFLGDSRMNLVHALDWRVAEFYGVTESQARTLLLASGTTPTGSLMKNLREMYGGLGLRDEESKRTVYNTQSIIRYCEEKVMKPYWEAALGILPFKKLLTPERGGPDLEEAMHRAILKLKTQELDVEGLFQTRDYLNGKPGYCPWDMQRYLWESGFLSNSSKNGGSHIIVPNNENRLILLDSVLNKDYYMTKHGLSETHVHNFVVSVAHLDGSEASVQLLADCVSYLFAKGARNMLYDSVNAYRYALYNYLRQTDADVFGEVEAELGPIKDKRSDIVVIRRDDMKIFLGLSSNKKSGEDALKQVLGDEQVKELGWLRWGNRFVCLGINLHRRKKRCDLAYLNGSIDIARVKKLSKPYCVKTGKDSILIGNMKV